MAYCYLKVLQQASKSYKTSLNKMRHVSVPNSKLVCHKPPKMSDTIKIKTSLYSETFNYKMEKRFKLNAAIINYKINLLTVAIMVND